MKAGLLVALLALSLAFVPDKILEDAGMETRAHRIIAQLKCFVCAGQPLAQSHVPLAQDLRSLVRHLLQQGKSDEEVLGYVVARYGEEVLLQPPFRGETLLLWFAPFLFLLALGFWLWRQFFREGAK